MLQLQRVIFMTKTIKKVFLSVLSVILCIGLLLLTLFVFSIFAGIKSIDKNIEFQNNHLEYLKNEYYKEYTPCDEQSLSGFDIEKAVADGVKFNEVAFLGTHNSYQTLPTKEQKALMKTLDFFALGFVETKTEFQMDTLTEQLDLGIRNLEIDVIVQETDDGTKFRVCHKQLLENTSSCYDFELALKEIKLWSDNNPNHLPITVIIEPKGKVVETGGFKTFSLDYCNQMDEIIRNTLGSSHLSPAQMLRDYKNFKEMRFADDWLTLGETRGKIMVLLHDCNVTDSYIAQDESIKTQAMFPMLRYDDRNETYTSFVLNNDPNSAVEQNNELVHECKLIVRTRADDYPTFSDERYNKANKCGSQIMTTDYPRRVNKTDNHIYDFDGYMFKLLK